MSKKKIDLSKYTSKILHDPTSSFNSLEVIPSPSVEKTQDIQQTTVNLVPSGFDQGSKGVRQMMAHFDYTKWAEQMGSSSIKNPTEENENNYKTQRQKRHSELSKTEIDILKKRRGIIKKKHKYNWLYDKETK